MFQMEADWGLIVHTWHTAELTPPAPVPRVGVPLSPDHARYGFRAPRARIVQRLLVYLLCPSHGFRELPAHYCFWPTQWYLVNGGRVHIVFTIDCIDMVV